MPPSQETPLEKKDIANTNLNHDISESVPSTAKKAPTSNKSLIVSKPPAGEDNGNEARAPAPSKAVRPVWARLIRMLGLRCLVSPFASYIYSHSGKSKFPFLALPIEIRLQIYDILLINRLNNYKQKIIFTNYKTRWADFEILQTCRQIYDEGNSILYSRNEFHFFSVDSAFKFIEQIGPVNFRSIRSLHIRVDNITAFLGLFIKLAEEENGVRVMEFTGISGGVSGTGDKLDFISTLKKTREMRQMGKEPYISLQDGRYRLYSKNGYPDRIYCYYF
jgi:hypothetical protein